MKKGKGENEINGIPLRAKWNSSYALTEFLLEISRSLFLGERSFLL